MNKNWDELSSDIVQTRYADFLKILWHDGGKNLNTAKGFRNKKKTKERIVVGKKIYKMKLKKNNKINKNDKNL